MPQLARKASTDRQLCVVSTDEAFGRSPSWFRRERHGQPQAHPDHPRSERWSTTARQPRIGVRDPRVPLIQGSSRGSTRDRQLEGLPTRPTAAARLQALRSYCLTQSAERQLCRRSEVTLRRCDGSGDAERYCYGLAAESPSSHFSWRSHRPCFGVSRRRTFHRPEELRQPPPTTVAKARTTCLRSGACASRSSRRAGPCSSPASRGRSLWLIASSADRQLRVVAERVMPDARERPLRNHRSVHLPHHPTFLDAETCISEGTNDVPRCPAPHGCPDARVEEHKRGPPEGTHRSDDEDRPTGSFDPTKHRERSEQPPRVDRYDARGDVEPRAAVLEVADVAVANPAAEPWCPSHELGLCGH